MSILKSIYKVRNRDSQTYDTLHPETEHSQVVDFGQGILSHLQSNVLASAISAMTSDSLFAKMMKLVLDASGVKYSMAQNGYVCLGSFFGGLIIQWGKITTTWTVTFPVTFTDLPVISTQELVTAGEIGEIQAMAYKSTLTTTGFSVGSHRIDGSGTDSVQVDWIAVGFYNS